MRGVGQGAARRKGAERQRRRREQEQSASSFQSSHRTLQRCFRVGAVAQIYPNVYRFDGHCSARLGVATSSRPERRQLLPSGSPNSRVRRDQLAARGVRRQGDPADQASAANMPMVSEAGGMTVSPGEPARRPGR